MVALKSPKKDSCRYDREINGSLTRLNEKQPFYKNDHCSTIMIKVEEFSTVKSS